MKFIETIKNKIGNYLLLKQYNKMVHNATMHNFETAKSIGIIFNATQNKMYEKTKDLVKYLQDKNINVTAIGYVDSKQAIDYYAYVKGFSFFDRKKVNWFGKPESSIYEEFISKKFDILLDLTLEESFVAKYCVMLSKALFKVGWYNAPEGYYDLMIEIGSKKDIEFYIEQLVHYLTLLKK